MSHSELEDLPQHIHLKNDLSAHFWTGLSVCSAHALCARVHKCSAFACCVARPCVLAVLPLYSFHLGQDVQGLSMCSGRLATVHACACAFACAHVHVCALRVRCAFETF